MAKETENILEIRALHKSFGDNEILKGLNLEIQEGKLYGLVGKNGAGKTTLYRLLLGLSFPNSGEICFSDKYKNLFDFRAKIGYFLDDCFFPGMTAKQNIDYNCRRLGLNVTEESARVLKIVGLDKIKNKYSGFSMGEKRRLGIAFAILGDPDLLILDEPINGLDPVGVKDVRKLIKELNTKYGKTIVVSSHVLAELENTVDHFAILNDGRIIKMLSKDELSNASAVIRVKPEDKQRAIQVLRDAGFEIGEGQGNESLEDYFFDVVNKDGGEKNA